MKEIFTLRLTEHQHAEENEQNEGTDIVGNPWGEETEEKIPEPVGRASKRNGFGSNTQRERFSEVHPSTRRRALFYERIMDVDLTHGVGPQKMENAQTCITAKAINVSPGSC